MRESLQDTATDPRSRRTRGTLRRVGIAGTGSYAPEHVLSNADLERMVDTSDEWIRARTGMQERRIARPDQATSDLAIQAGRRALQDAGLAADELDLIVVATATPDTLFPATACRVQAGLGAHRAATFDISAACSGFVHALTTCQGLLASRAFDHALVIGAEVLSSIVDYKDRNTCVLFGDAAGAVVLAPCSGEDPPGELLDNVIGTDSSGIDLIQQPGGGSRHPATAETVAANLHFMKLEGRKVFKFAVNAICESVDQILRRNGLTLDDLDLLIPHQANLRIIEAATERLGLDPSRVAVNIERYGNTSSASIPLVLDELARAGRLQRGQLVCLAAFGAGLSWGTTLLRW
ncbi:MAG: ketoacyl-ACP synthase III [Planctomycetes bacterium]|nr:ketoacyl-ACP synthase III [Planctomycetota bacterium]MCB9871952.1 ketoacyl-ACP synthase III [Planctomycetota bacterium]